MTLQEIIKTLQNIALTQPNVRSVGEGDVYDALNAEGSTKYAYFFITQNKHQQTEDTDVYNLNVFYIDRLEDSKENKLQIQSIGKEVLANVFNVFCDDFDAEMGNIEYQPFTERFSDMCAGVYATVTFEVMKETSCADYYGSKYEPYIPIKINNQNKSEKFTINGEYSITYDKGYTGLEKIDILVDVDSSQYYDQGYNDGYSQGETDGYGQGYANGYSQVYNDAESISITENGVYNADENLFNKVEVNVDVTEYYDKGYEDGAKEAASNAEVLDVTQNGTYYTKYADIPEWTEPETGDDFYSYITAQENALSTGYKGDTNTVVELWYRHYGDVSNGVILQRFSYSNAFKLMLTEETGSVKIGSKTFDFYLPVYQFNKIRFSTKGIWVNDEQVSEFDVEYTNDAPVWEIGGNGNLAQGDYGMIKIDDNVYVPTSDGFLDTATNEILPNVGLSTFVYTYTELIKPVVYENLFKQVNVDFKISAKKTGLKLGYSTFKEIPDYIDFDGVTNWFGMFYACQDLVDISKLEGITVTNGSEMFVMSDIEDASITSTWNTSGSTTFSKIFQTCGNLKKIGIIDCTSITSSNTHPLYMVSNTAPLTDIEGFPNMKASQTGSGFDRCPNLSHQSYINIFNSIYNFTGNGEKPTSSQGKIKLHSNAYNILSEDDIAIATNKGWTLS